MDIGEARELVAQLIEEQQEARVLLAECARKVAGINKVIDGYVHMFPELEELTGPRGDRTPPVVGSAPKGAEAVRIVLQERANYWWYISELLDALRERGWLPESENPANAVRTACERLLGTEGSDLHKGRGLSGKIVYSYRPDDEPWDGELRTINDEEEPF